MNIKDLITSNPHATVDETDERQIIISWPVIREVKLTEKKYWPVGVNRPQFDKRPGRTCVRIVFN